MSRILVDAHLDLAYSALIVGRDLRSPVEDIRARERVTLSGSLDNGTCLVSIPELLKGNIAIAFGSIFVPPSVSPEASLSMVYHDAEEAHTYGVAQLDYYRRLIDDGAPLCLLQTLKDLEMVLASWETSQPRLGVFVVMEGAEPIKQPDDLGWWAERGLRGLGLSWSAGTSYAGGNAAPGPLTDKGRRLLRRMADYNLLLDLSHLWPDAVYEALDCYPGPVAASHANPRAFVDSPRLLSDDLLKRIASRDGVVGIIPFNQMLEQGWKKGDPRLPLQRVVEAIDYVCQCVGSADYVGLGSDFDGGFGLASVPEEINTVADLVKIADLLGERGYCEADIDAILSCNWLRILRRVLEAF